MHDICDGCGKVRKLSKITGMWLCEACENDLDSMIAAKQQEDESFVLDELNRRVENAGTNRDGA